MKVFTIENDTNNITVHSTAKGAEYVPNSERFGSEAALAKVAAEWPMTRLVEIWNSLPGVTPVNKFKDRATAVSRIWKAIQNLDAAAPEMKTEESHPEPASEISSEPETAPLAQEAAVEPTPVAEPIEVAPEAETPAIMEQPEPEAPETTSQPGPKVIAEATATDVAPQAAHVAPEPATSTKKATQTKNAQDRIVSAPREGSKTAQVIGMLKREGGTTLEEIMTAMGWQKHTTRAMLSAGGSLTKNHGLVVVSEKVGDQKRYSIKA